MRERIAIIICIVALCLAAVLSAIFAVRHNPAVPHEHTVEPGPTFDEETELAVPGPLTDAVVEPQPPGEAAASHTPPTALIERGRKVYDEQKCGTCHSIAGSGNPRNPLDESATRLQPEELRAWITGAPSVAANLSGAVLRRKERYKSMPEESMEALVAYLSAAARGTE